MTPERWRRVEEVFHSALERPEAERAAWLASTCQDDRPLRDEVARLLAVDSGAAEAVSTVVAGGWRQLSSAGQWFGPYRVLSQLGRGGMGTVYLAARDDEAYHKQVAVKVVPRSLVTGPAVARFRDERQILATLNHPNIARLLDGGSTDDGLPYLVMELVEGRPLLEHCRERARSIDDRLRLFLQICAAVQYAHQNLVIHRDIKPANILVTHDGTPKLLDFGIAKLLGPEAARHAATGSGARILTPAYASPEQVLGRPISTASDIYSLGALLYELLSGVRAHALDAGGAAELVRVVCEVEPPKPSQVAPAHLRRRLTGDLDTIVSKAMQKDPARRYASVEQLAADVASHRQGLPILARRELGYRAVRLLRRHRVPVAAGLLVLASMGTGLVVARQQARRAERRFADVRALANSVLFELDDAIAPLPGSTAARGLLVRKALEYLDRLASDRGDDPALQLELGISYAKVGDVQGNVFGPNLGRLADAQRSYEAALALLDPLSLTRAGDVAVLEARARVRTSIGKILAHQGAVVAANVRLRESIQLAEQLPESEVSLRLRTRAWGSLSDLQRQRGEPDAAASARRYLRSAEELARVAPSASARYEIATAYEMNAMIGGVDGQPAAAIRDAVEARQIFESLVAEHPSNASYQRELGASFFILAALSGGPEQFHLGDTPSALRWIEQGLSIMEARRRVDPGDMRARHDFALFLALKASVLGSSDPARAVLVGQRAAAELRTQPPEALENLNVVGDLAAIESQLAPPLLLLGRVAEADDTLARALGVQRWLAPRSVAWRRGFIESLGRLAALRLAQRDLDGALAAANEAERTAAGLAAENPSALIIGRAHADSQCVLGNVHVARARRGLSSCAEARRWYERGIATWSVAATSGRGSGFGDALRAEAARGVAACAHAAP